MSGLRHRVTGYAFARTDKNVCTLSGEASLHSPAALSDVVSRVSKSKSKLWTCTGSARTGADPKKARCLNANLYWEPSLKMHYQSFRISGREVGCGEGSPNKAKALHGALGAAAAESDAACRPWGELSAPVLSVDTTNSLTEFGPRLA